VKKAHPISIPGIAGLFARLACCALLLSLLGACVVIPRGDLAGTHKGVSDSVIRSIQPGSTTRADILLQLSEPWIRGTGDRYFVYSWVESLGGAGVLLYPAIFVESIVESFKCHCLVVQFSDLGQVERITVLSDSGTAIDMTAFPCPSQQMQEIIQQWLAQSPARP